MAIEGYQLDSDSEARPTRNFEAAFSRRVFMFLADSNPT